MDDPFDSPIRRALRQIEEQQHLWQSLGGVPAVLKDVERLRNLTRTALGSQSEIGQYIQDLQLGRDRYRDVLTALGGPDRLRDALSLAEAQGRSFELINRRELVDAASGAKAMIASLGVGDILKDARFAVLENFARPEEDALAAIGAAASHFQMLHDTSSFARLGRAIDAASGAFAADRLATLDYRPILDPFFGDWTRIEMLPDTYASDPGARREVLEQIEADEAFLDVTTEEAAALIEETSLDSGGIPVTLMGEPVGLVLIQNPDDAAARVIRRVERALRTRIVSVLSSKHGEDWADILMPEQAARWSEKRAEDKRQGLGTHRLIDYSDFTELAMIIEKRWNDGFSGRVSKASRVTGRIRALAPHRNYEFHSRPVTPEQLVFILYAALELQPFLVEDEGSEGANN